ncbi:hypothetical protein [Reyranella sp. CPCC 100927]|uniref:hypothetical protein n=1 Tax=Reyranella sp. CPCC 100927 TaxID=2599616 RepID=UPI0011B55B8C|nr:hypothetical protein [Reyranella sp. CPCC 100927]TWT11485.1 hypothetical protein FQU96_13455 [Reyranella sp. CPCC 100927]
MSQPSKPIDPFSLWRDWLGEFEKRSNTSLNEAMSSEQFAQMFGQSTGLAMGVQKVVGETMTRHLTALNLPTRADIAALGERLNAVETLLNKIVDRLDRSDAVAAAPDARAPRPPKTRKPPAQGAP